MGKASEDMRDDSEALKEATKKLIQQYRKKHRSQSDCTIIEGLLAIYANANISPKQSEMIARWLINRMLKKKTKTVVWEKIYRFFHSRLEALSERNRENFVSATESTSGKAKISQLKLKMENLQRRQKPSS